MRKGLIQNDVAIGFGHHLSKHTASPLPGFLVEHAACEGEEVFGGCGVSVGRVEDVAE